MTESTESKRELLRRVLQDRVAKQQQGKPSLERDEATPPMRRISREGDMELSFGQEMIWLLEQIIPEAMFYNVVERFEIRGRFDVGFFQRALDEVVKRHEILRTVYLNVDGHPVQRVQPPATCRIGLHDLSDLPISDREGAARRLILTEVKTPFDLAVGPILRPMLIQFADEEFVCVLVIHHMAIDGYSLRLFVNEVATFYAAFLENRAPVCPRSLFSSQTSLIGSGAG